MLLDRQHMLFWLILEWKSHIQLGCQRATYISATFDPPTKLKLVIANTRSILQGFWKHLHYSKDRWIQSCVLLTLQTSTTVAVGYLPHVQRRQCAHFWATQTPVHWLQLFHEFHFPLKTGKHSSQHLCMKPPQDTLCSRKTGLQSDGRLKFRFAV